MEKNMEVPHVQKKRGRRPKGGKIVVNKPNNNNNLLTNKKINLQKNNHALELLSYSTAIIAIRSTNLTDS